MASTVLVSPGSPLIEDRCRTVTLADRGWLDAQVINAVAEVLLTALDYRVEIEVARETEIIEAIRVERIDAFLAFWPDFADESLADAALPAGVVRLASVVDDVRFGLAVPAFQANAGLRSISDIADHGGELDHRLIGVDANNPINWLLEELLELPELGLERFRFEPMTAEERDTTLSGLAASGEAFLAFAVAPSALEASADLVFLEDGGLLMPEDAARRIDMLVHPALAGTCENVVNFLKKLTFERHDLSAMMARIMEGRLPREVAIEWLLAEAGWLERTLAGIDDAEGRAILIDDVRIRLKNQP
jgi:glycine betaine/proline transport system substrate-binding protein